MEWFTDPAPLSGSIGIGCYVRVMHDSWASRVHSMNRARRHFKVSQVLGVMGVRGDSYKYLKARWRKRQRNSGDSLTE